MRTSAELFPGIDRVSETIPLHEVPPLPHVGEVLPHVGEVRAAGLRVKG